jgi:PadR family transcriptional regulator PadR
MEQVMMARIDLLQGTLDVLILKTLSWGPLHGYAIARFIKRATGEVLQIEEGALYPALHRMERRGWIESDWGVSENNRRAKYYQLKPKGRKALRDETSTWHRYVEAVGMLLQLERPEPA